jgi:hypothetical protein
VLGEDTRKIIARTLKNIDSIYCDVGRIAQIIEEKLLNRGFEPLGDAAISWGSSASIYRPSDWLRCWFPRAYINRKEPKVLAGFCVHLGDYESAAGIPDTDAPVSYPFLGLSVPTGFSKEATTRQRTGIYEALWRSGWFDDDLVLEGEVVKGRTNVRGEQVDTTTVFVDLFEMDSPDAIQTKVVDRLTRLHSSASGRG